MLRIKRKNSGQTSIEYTILLIVVIASFLTIQNYMKRGIQGRFRDSVDDMGDQYDPLTSISDMRHTLTSNTSTNIIAIDSGGGYWTKRTDTSNSRETKKGNITVGAY